MQEKDREDFIRLLLQINEVCANPRNISDEVIDFYFEILNDLPYEVVRHNASLYFRFEKGFFPTPYDLRGGEIQKRYRELVARQVWERLTYYLTHKYFPGFGKASMDAIKVEMERKGEAELFPLLLRWGPEMANTTALAATRKHFIESLVAGEEIREFKQIAPNGTMKELVEGVMKQLTGKTNE